MNSSGAIETYQHLERELTNLIGKIKFDAKINLRLERISHLLELLDHPQNSFTSIHVGGTSGKGSTATMISTILTEAGYKTGLHLSPHLQILNERHQINNQVASSTRLAELYAEIKPAIEQVGRENSLGKPTYFEAQVALMLYYFRAEKVDVAVIEVGLGGTLDATNVIPASVAVLTNVGLDHTEILGHKIEMIARDKAGIIKSQQTVVNGFLQPSAQAIVAERCHYQQATLWQIYRDFGFFRNEHNSHFMLETPGRKYEDLQMGMCGDFQISNAACAVTAVKALKNLTVPDEAIRNGLARAFIPGRMEVVQQHPQVVLDGAHNPDKMAVAARAMREFKRRRQITVLALKSDKAIEEILKLVLEITDYLIITAFYVKALWEAAPPEVIEKVARTLRPDLEIQIIPDPIEAVKKALALADSTDLIWVTGSLYLVGDIREYWYPSTKLIEQAETGLSGSLIC